MAYGQAPRSRGQNYGNPQHNPRREAAPEESWSEDGQDEAFDTALHLASHAQRLKNIENHFSHVENGIRNIRNQYAQDRQRQNVLMGILAGGFILSVLITAFARPSSAPPRVAQQAPVQQRAADVMPPSLAQGLALAGTQIQNNTAPQQQMQQQLAAPIPQGYQPAYQPQQQYAPQQPLQQQVQQQPMLQRAPQVQTPSLQNPQMQQVPVQQPVYQQAPVQQQQPYMQPQSMNAPTINSPSINSPAQNPNVQALGARYDQQQRLPASALAPAQIAPQRALSPFQQQVRTRLQQRSENVPAEWQPLFDRDAKGDRKGRLLVAAKFLKGEGVTRDQAFAVEIIRGAADEGEKEAMMWLAYANQGGNLGKVDIMSAIRWFEAAGRAGVAQAYTELGRIYETGVDGAPDLETAVAWYQRAKQAGDSKAGEALARLSQPISQQFANGAAQANLAVDPSLEVQRMIAGGGTQTTMDDSNVFVPASPAPAYQPTAPIAARSVAASMPVPSAQVGMDPDEASADVRAAQRMLKALGYRIDHVDGQFGPQTADAIRAYQRDRTLYPDGEPSAQLIEALSRDVRYSE